MNTTLKKISLGIMSADSELIDSSDLQNYITTNDANIQYLSSEISSKGGGDSTWGNIKGTLSNQTDLNDVITDLSSVQDNIIKNIKNLETLACYECKLSDETVFGYINIGSKFNELKNITLLTVTCKGLSVITDEYIFNHYDNYNQRTNEYTLNFNNDEGSGVIKYCPTATTDNLLAVKIERTDINVTLCGDGQLINTIGTISNLSSFSNYLITKDINEKNKAIEVSTIKSYIDKTFIKIFKEDLFTNKDATPIGNGNYYGLSYNLFDLGCNVNSKYILDSITIRYGSDNHYTRTCKLAVWKGSPSVDNLIALSINSISTGASSRGLDLKYEFIGAELTSNFKYYVGFTTNNGSSAELQRFRTTNNSEYIKLYGNSALTTVSNGCPIITINYKFINYINKEDILNILEMQEEQWTFTTESGDTVTKTILVNN